jgi:hypothetical protein
MVDGYSGWEYNGECSNVPGRPCTYTLCLSRIVNIANIIYVHFIAWDEGIEYIYQLSDSIDYCGIAAFK